MGIEALSGLHHCPFDFAAGEAWLSKHQEDQLRAWVEANRAVLLAYWDGDILYDQDLRAKLVDLARRALKHPAASRMDRNAVDRESAMSYHRRQPGSHDGHDPHRRLTVQTYDDDYYGWTQQQAAHLRSGRMDRVDLENLAEEIESLGKSQESELASRYKVLCLHLLKQIVQAASCNGRSWEATIAEQRASIAVHLRRNPGLKPKKAGLFADGYEIARKTAKAETGLPLSSFPATPPFTIDEAEDETFVPKPAA